MESSEPPADAAAPDPAGLAARRAADVGVTEEMIFELVDAFYEQARSDPTLGPIYQRVVGDRWAGHLAKMCDFWSAVTLGTHRFSGAPVEAHLRIGELRATHFGRWLYLFGRTARKVCPQSAAELFVGRAEAVAEGLQAAIAAARLGASACEADAAGPKKPAA